MMTPPRDTPSPSTVIVVDLGSVAPSPKGLVERLASPTKTTPAQTAARHARAEQAMAKLHSMKRDRAAIKAMYVSSAHERRMSIDRERVAKAKMAELRLEAAAQKRAQILVERSSSSKTRGQSSYEPYHVDEHKDGAQPITNRQAISGIVLLGGAILFVAKTMQTMAPELEPETLPTVQECFLGPRDWLVKVSAVEAAAALKATIESNPMLAVGTGVGGVVGAVVPVICHLLRSKVWMWWR